MFARLSVLWRGVRETDVVCLRWIILRGSVGRRVWMGKTIWMILSARVIERVTGIQNNIYLLVFIFAKMRLAYKHWYSLKFSTSYVFWCYFPLQYRFVSKRADFFYLLSCSSSYRCHLRKKHKVIVKNTVLLKQKSIRIVELWKNKLISNKEIRMKR